MSPTVVTFLFEAANFLVLAVALSWLFFKPVRKSITDYREKLESDSRLAAEKLAAAEAVQQEMNNERTRLETELNQRRHREIEAAQQQAARILADARSVADQEIEKSHRQASRMSENQRDRLAEVSAAAAAEAVGQLLRQLGGPDLQAALVQLACRQLETLSAKNLAPVKIESAHELSAEQFSMLRHAIGTHAASADFRIVDSLGAGVRIYTAQGLVDASASGLAHFARQSLVKEMQHRANNHNPWQQIGNV